MKAQKQLIASVSGVRGIVGNGLDPVLVARYGAAFGTYLKKGKVVVGRDSRPSGDMIQRAVVAGLVSAGIDVIEIGVVPTPTVEIAVKSLRAAGGICVTASHNPAPWNALKFFNAKGEFLTPAEYKRFNAIVTSDKIRYQPVQGLGKITLDDRWVEEHIKRTLAQKVVNCRQIKNRKFKVVVDAINGAGSFALPELLERMGVKVVRINCNGDGNFVHEPEPTPKNLRQLGRAVKQHKADIGLACDPDADRLALVDETGKPISEELTLTIAVQEVLRQKKGPVVINLSTSKATEVVARESGAKVFYSKVGEANVVEVMHKRKAVIGGEGNGGVIFPSFHAGRDSLIAAAITLSAMAHQKRPVSEIVATLPVFHAIKGKAPLPRNFETRLTKLEKLTTKLLGRTKVDRRDGLRFDFEKGWLQLRKSNTEPIFRLIVETSDKRLTRQLYEQVLKHFQ